MTTNKYDEHKDSDVVHNPQIPKSHQKPIKEYGMEYMPSGAILRGVDDENNAYWNSFLPIFFDRVNIATRRVVANCVKDFGLNAIHAEYLIALNLREGMTLVELSKFLDVDTANTNRVVKTLREKGLVYDDRQDEKSKGFKVYLTEEGIELADHIMVETQACMNGFFKGIPRFSVDNLRNTLIKILYNTDPDFEEYVDSDLVNPFFTYMGLAWDEESPEALRFGEKEYEDE